MKKILSAGVAAEVASAEGQRHSAGAPWLWRVLWMLVLGLSVLAVLGSLLFGTVAPARLLAALTGSSLGFVATLLGALLVVLLPRRALAAWLDRALSLSGGMMLAAAIFALLEPAQQQLTSYVSVTTEYLPTAAARHLGEIQPSEAQPSAAQPGEVQPGEAQPSEVQPGEVQPGAATAGGGAAVIWLAQLGLVLATLAGAMLMALLARGVPNSHLVAADNPAATRQQLRSDTPVLSQRLWLFVGAIALHNLPEGLAVGVGFAGPEATLGSSVSLAIALQDVPEGFAMALVLQKLRVPLATILQWSLLAALLEPAGAVLAVSISQSLGALLALSYPLLLAMAAGAMLFVVVHQVIPETHSAGSSQSPAQSSLLLLAGFLLLWLLDSEVLVAALWAPVAVGAA